MALFLLFSVIDGFELFWMESFHKNIQLILEFLKALFLVQQFSCYTLMIFLMILSIILVSMLMILLSVLSVIRHLICGNNLNWLLYLNLIYETVDCGKKWLVDFNTGKTQLVLFDWSNNNGSIDVKMDGSVLEEKSSLKMLGLNWIGVVTLSLLLKLPPKNCSFNWFYEVLSPEVALYLYKAVICPCIEYYCHV